MKESFNPTVDKKKIDWLEERVDDYYNALMDTFNKIIDRQPSDEALKRKREQFNLESEFIYRLLHTPSPVIEYELTLEWVKKNNLFEILQIKPLSLPDFYSKKKIKEAYRFIENNVALELWKFSGYVQSFGLELAQGKALDRYRIELDKQKLLSKFKLTKKRRSKDDVTESFKWNFKVQESWKKEYKQMVEDLTNSLSQNKFIDKATDPADLSLIFEKTKLSEIEKPIKWTGTNVELSFFVKELYNNLKAIEPVRSHWAVTVNCFMPVDGGSFLENQLAHPGKISTIRRKKLLKCLKESVFTFMNKYNINSILSSYNSADKGN